MIINQSINQNKFTLPTHYIYITSPQRGRERDRERQRQTDRQTDREQNKIREGKKRNVKEVKIVLMGWVLANISRGAGRRPTDEDDG